MHPDIKNSYLKYYYRSFKNKPNSMGYLENILGEIEYERDEIENDRNSVVVTWLWTLEEMITNGSQRTHHYAHLYLNQYKLTHKQYQEFKEIITPTEEEEQLLAVIRIINSIEVIPDDLHPDKKFIIKLLNRIILLLQDIITKLKKLDA